MLIIPCDCTIRYKVGSIAANKALVRKLCRGSDYECEKSLMKISDIEPEMDNFEARTSFVPGVLTRREKIFRSGSSKKTPGVFIGGLHRH
jgi:hypothetical protein